MVFDQHGAPPAPDTAPAAEEQHQAAPVDRPRDLAPPSRLNVGRGSTFDTARGSSAPGHLGPITISGTRMSVSNAVCLPCRSRYSPMWKPLSELKTMYVSSSSPRGERDLDAGEELVDGLHSPRAAAEVRSILLIARGPSAAWPASQGGARSAAAC